MHSITPTILHPPSPLSRFREGFSAPLEGFRWLNQHPGLWRYAILPILLNLLVTLIVLAAAIAAVIWFGGQISSYFARFWWGELLKWLAWVALFLLALGVGLGTWLLLQGILVGYFNGLLARRVELQLGMRAEDMRELSFVYQAIDGVMDLIWLIAINVGLLVLHFIPVIGSLIAIPLTLYIDTRMLGDDLIDFPLELRGLRRHEKQAMFRGHRWESAGLGASCFAFTLIPIIGSIGLTAGTVGAVLMHRRWSGMGKGET